MSLTNIEQVMPVKLAQALANPLFPALDSALRAGRHIGLDELDNHAFLMDFQDYLEEFYARYNVELIRAPEVFLPAPAFHHADFALGAVRAGYDGGQNSLLSLSQPGAPGKRRIFTQQELYDELLTLADESRLLKLVNNRSTGSDLDRQKLQEKMRASLNRLRRLGMVWFMGHDSSKFRITESVFRFGADVRAGDDPREAQRRLIRDGKRWPWKITCSSMMRMKRTSRIAGRKSND
jgi:chromosome partition protein MukE